VTFFGESRNACVMTFQTFAHGWATLPAMDRSGDDCRIIVEGTDERMLAKKLQRLLLRGASPDELPQGPEAVALIGKGCFAGRFELGTGVLARE